MVQHIICSSALSAVLYLLLANITYLWFYAATVFAFIALNAVFLYHCRGTVFAGPDSALVVGKDGKDALLNIISSTWRYMFCIASIGYVSGMTRMFVQQSGGSSFSVSISMGIGMFIATMGLALLWLKMAKRLSFSMVYTVLFFVVMTGLSVSALLRYRVPAFFRGPCQRRLFGSLYLYDDHLLSGGAVAADRPYRRIRSIREHRVRLGTDWARHR